MNRILASTLVLALAATPLIAADAAPAATPAAKPAAKPAKKAATADSFANEDERTFYAYGYRIGQSLSQFGPTESEAKAIARGLREAAAGKKSAVDLSVYLPKLSDTVQKRVLAKAAGQKEKGKAYAEAFSKEAGVTPITGGGWMKTLAEGSGQNPKLDDTVKVNYRGTFIDGTEFDSSAKHNGPASFVLREVISCWTNGVAAMKIGGKAKLVCPSEAAYGDQTKGPIPGGSTLVFEVELLDVTKAAASGAPSASTTTMTGTAAKSAKPASAKK